MAARKTEETAPVVDETVDDVAAVERTDGRNAVPAGEPAPSVEADPAEHAVAMPSLLADGTPEHPKAAVLVDEDDPRLAHFEG